VSVYTISIRNNASIFNFCTLLDGQVNLVGTLGRSKFKIPNTFQKRTRNNKIKIKKNWNFYSKSEFDKINF